MRENCVEILYSDAVTKVSTSKQKLKQKEYLSKGVIPIVDQGQALIGGYTNDKRKTLNCSLPVIVFGDHTKIVKLIKFPFAPGADGTKVLEPSKYIHPKYLSFLTQILVCKIKDKGYARHYQHIEKEYLPLVSLPEQRAIVSKIETLFSDLDNGVTDLKKAQEQLKLYRQAVLSATVTNSQKIPISELVNNLSQGWSPKCVNRKSDDLNEWAVIKTSSIQGLRFIENENKILPQTLQPREQHEIKVGDLLITRAGPRIRVGICCLVKRTRPRLINCDKVYRINIKKEKILPEYFEYSLNSPEHLRLIEKIKSGSNDSGLNLTQNRFLSLEIPLPEIPEQTQIVKEIKSRLSVCVKAEESIAHSLIKAEALRQSILKKAFEGKVLSISEIEKCKKEADYEPAAFLLERIKNNNPRKC